MIRSFFVLTLIATLAVLWAPASASATNQVVQVGDNFYDPGAVAVKPGETVSWNYPGTQGSDHHNVHFDDGQFIDPTIPAFPAWATTWTSSAEGLYRYHCDEHGGFGGQGMSGVVYVNQTGTLTGIPPTASFTVAPTVAAVGQNVLLNAAASSAAVGTITKYEWDLDGNGSYETNTGTVASTSMAYATPGMRTLRLRVTDSQGLTNEATRSLMVNAVPTASFTVSPNPALTGQTVTFNGSASVDADGTIAKYEWDLDGDGSYETDTGTTATVTKSYATAGTRSVKLRVTDNANISASSTQSLRVNAPAPPARPPATTTPVTPVAPAPATPVKPTCSSLSGSKRAACMQRSCRRLKGTKRSRCVLKSCRYLKGKSRSRCRLKSCRYLKGSKKRACVRKYRRRK
jgi:plastocyanin